VNSTVLGEVAHVRLLGPDLVDQVIAAVLALLGGARLRELEDVGLGHDVGVERAGGEADIDHAALHRLADLEGRDRLRAADEVQLQRALAFLVDLLDPLDGALHVELVLRERAHHTQGDFLGLGGDRRQRERRQQKRLFHGPPPMKNEQVRRRLCHLSNQCHSWYSSIS
jgi:hypothetical protein